jgi:CPA2 family monovalent cation:H+ antiporter-2
VVPEALESSLMLASHALVVMGIPLRRVVHRVQAARDERYASLRGFFPGAGDLVDDHEHSYVRLHSVTLRDDAGAVGRCIAELELDEVGAEITAVRRGNERIEPTAETELRAGDVVVLRGTGSAVTRAEGRLLR